MQKLKNKATRHGNGPEVSMQGLQGLIKCKCLSPQNGRLTK